MMLCEWRTFSTDSETYSQETFEKAVGDEFEAMISRITKTFPPISGQ